MFRKTIAEAMAQRKKDKDDRDKKKTSESANIATEKTMGPTVIPASSEAHFTHHNLVTSPLETIFDARLSAVMSDTDRSEYETLICVMQDSDEAKVDWREAGRDVTDLAFEAILP